MRKRSSGTTCALSNVPAALTDHCVRQGRCFLKQHAKLFWHVGCCCIHQGEETRLARGKVVLCSPQRSTHTIGVGNDQGRKG